MSYQILPFRYNRYNDDTMFLSNEVGEYCFISKYDFEKYINCLLDKNSNTFKNLKSKYLLVDNEDIDSVVGLLSIKYRTKKSYLNDFTSLHMVVPTQRCNSNCIYCQVSKKNINETKYDMNKNTARNVVDCIFKSPSKMIKIEFQGGEPLLNFSIIKYIIEYAEWKNIIKQKDIEFIICTNLTLINEKMLKYLKKHNVFISTSLDGSKEIHNKNRPLLDSNNSYDLLMQSIELCKKYLGEYSVSALMTTSSYNVNNLNVVVDEYKKLGFNAIFIRSLNPYGLAKQNKDQIGYNIEQFIDNYKKVLDYIVNINRNGYYLIEGYASILLTRILTPFSTGFVDLQSPSGIGISGVIYNYNGNVYVSDEGRMLSAMGDEKFYMGNVNQNNYNELFNSEYLKSLIKMSCLESLPECSYCAYQTYCGADPVRNYSEQKDIIGRRSKSDICYKNKSIIKYLLELLKINNNSINNVFWSWITRKPINN